VEGSWGDGMDVLKVGDTLHAGGVGRCVEYQGCCVQWNRKGLRSNSAFRAYQRKQSNKSNDD
jgi:hypothetical protein